MQDRPAFFDTQAAEYEQRAGLSAQHCQTIAQAVLALADLPPGGLLLEVGAGTGMLGTWLSQPPWRYIGLDLSYGMLTIFRHRQRCQDRSALLLQADANRPWPLADGTVEAFFSSRALHLLEMTHVIAETFRVAHPAGAMLLIGRLQRPPESGFSLLQREMQRLLRRAGWPARQGERHQDEILAAYGQRGATAFESLVALRRTVTWTPWQSIESWRAKSGLGGVDPPTAVKHAILDELRRWATWTFGDLQRKITCEETYLLRAIRILPGT